MVGFGTVRMAASVLVGDEDYNGRIERGSATQRPVVTPPTCEAATRGRRGYGSAVSYRALVSAGVSMGAVCLVFPIAVHAPTRHPCHLETLLAAPGAAAAKAPRTDRGVRVTWWRGGRGVTG